MRATKKTRSFWVIRDIVNNQYISEGWGITDDEFKAMRFNSYDMASDSVVLHILEPEWNTFAIVKILVSQENLEIRSVKNVKNRKA